MNKLRINNVRYITHNLLKKHYLDENQQQWGNRMWCMRCTSQKKQNSQQNKESCNLLIFAHIQCNESLYR